MSGIVSKFAQISSFGLVGQKAPKLRVPDETASEEKARLAEEEKRKAKGRAGRPSTILTGRTGEAPEKRSGANILTGQ